MAGNRVTTKNSGRAIAFCFMASSIAGLSLQVLSSPSPTAFPEPTPDQVAFFEAKIRPVLADRCFSCHGKGTQLGGLRLDTKEGVAKGGDSGPLLVPGNPDKSLLILAIRQSGQLKMPQGGKLGPDDVKNFEIWVKAGAPWPSKSTSAEPAKPPLWSLQPIVKPSLPSVKHKSWVKNPIDDFVMANLEDKHLAPAPPADKRTLIRRVTYDLTGLPPSAEEIDAFIADHSPEAYAKVVDRLLASPHYGERWARHWMDVARYADTKGYVFNEVRNYPNAYTYRNWLINAINDDLPYDQFVIKQLAADRLPQVMDGANKSDLAAMGFLTIGRRFLNAEPDIIDDRIDVTMRGFEGFTVACARCHDHKFDPIPTQDYYSIYSVFASSKEATEPISPKSISEPWVKFNREVSSSQAKIDEIIAEQVKKLREENSDPAKSGALSPEVKKVLQSLNPRDLPTGGNFETLNRAFPVEAQGEIQGLKAKNEKLNANAPPTPEFAMAMEDKPNPHDGFVFRRGNPGTPGPEAPRRFLLALSRSGVEREHWTKDSGRLELAEAIASKNNPLTARVFVNRVWLHHFGAGIVRTPSDFGRQGEPPTDPKLLDYLAANFMDSGWSMKKLHRLIVTSSTYCQSSAVSPATFNGDPDNRLWSRMNRQRLDLEEMRDSLVSVTGKLDLHNIGGKSVDIWSDPFSNRRAVYGFIERQNLPGIFRTFDFATPDSTSPKRFVTTVPQQALFFMNSPFVVDQAKSVADRPELKSSKNTGQRLRRLYRILFGRYPDSDEAALGLSYLGADPDSAVHPPESVWQYGSGFFDPVQQRTTGFALLDNFFNSAYHPTKKFPDPSLGYLVLNANGGHPGHDASHSAIRRWVAPYSMTVQIDGALSHRQAQGDGVEGRLVSSRLGLLGDWIAHNASTQTQVAYVQVQKGDTLDFIVDPRTNDGFDSFSWAPIIRTADGKQVWDSSVGFGPPPGLPITRFVLYAQALMMTNEFMFVD